MGQLSKAPESPKTLIWKMSYVVLGEDLFLPSLREQQAEFCAPESYWLRAQSRDDKAFSCSNLQPWEERPEGHGSGGLPMQKAKPMRSAE